jgi:hypothetical protein
MLKCNKGQLEIRGSVIDLIAELATLVHALHEDFGKAGVDHGDELLKKAFEDGMKTDDEMDEEIEGLKKKVLSNDEALNRLLQMLEEKLKGEKKDG